MKPTQPAATVSIRRFLRLPSDKFRIIQNRRKAVSRFMNRLRPRLGPMLLVQFGW